MAVFYASGAHVPKSTLRSSPKRDPEANLFGRYAPVFDSDSP